MNNIRQIQAINKRELEAGVPPSASWHREWDSSAWIYIGGLPYELSEGDLITVFSQFGEPVYINLVRDKETGKSKGFAFLKYEDQRSTDLAVDNLGGATLMGRTLRVDHTNYKRKEDEQIEDNTHGLDTNVMDGKAEKHEKHRSRRRSESEESRPMIKEERELAELMQNHDEDDPMKEYLVQQKREEVEQALKEYEASRHRRKKDDRRHSRREHRSKRKNETEHSTSRERRVNDRDNGESYPRESEKNKLRRSDASPTRSYKRRGDGQRGRRDRSPSSSQDSQLR